jgi:hypothetical protein
MSIHNRLPAYFLWVGSTLPDLARISILSAAEAGFETVLFSDRDQHITHDNLRISDHREIKLPFAPDQVRLKGETKPYFAGFADLFRYCLLAQTDGWWFDCDTIILRPERDFRNLFGNAPVVLGFEDGTVINNAVIGSTSKNEIQKLVDQALPFYPDFDKWGVTGPSLVSRLVDNRAISANVYPPSHFYPIHHSKISQIYLPAYHDALKEQEPEWFCLSLWGEVLSRTGLKHLAPAPESYLGDLLKRNTWLGGIETDTTAMAAYLQKNLGHLDDLSSGRVALATLASKLKQRLT